MCLMLYLMRIYQAMFVYKMLLHKYQYGFELGTKIQFNCSKEIALL